MDAYDLIVVGGVAAGTKVAAKTRREMPDWNIAIITDEAHISYAGCGLPYYLGDVITSEDELLVMTPEDFSREKNIDVLVRLRALSIDHNARALEVMDLDSGVKRSFYYRKLVIATGARPFRPQLPGIDLDRIYTVRNLGDAVRIKECILARDFGKVVIVGGGLIGVEMAENLAETGLEVTIVEMLPHILPMFDEEVAAFIVSHLDQRGVRVKSSTRVLGFSGKADYPGSVGCVITDGGSLNTDAVIFSIGVRPTTDLCDDVGVKLGCHGAIRAGPDGRTNIPDIYASGDCCTTFHRGTGEEAWLPMGSTANKHARAVGMTISGQNDKFPGVLGTCIVKAFDLTVGRTGLNAGDAEAMGIEAISVIVSVNDRAHYYPGAEKIFIKLLVDRNTTVILGGQIWGEGCVDKPLDALVVAITMKATLDDLAKMDFAYSPPYSSAINPLNQAAMVLSNKLCGKLHGINPLVLHRRMETDGWEGIILDVRDASELEDGVLSGSIHIPMVDLGERIDEIREFAGKEIVLVCGIGRRAYESLIRLRHMGFDNVAILEGGVYAWPFGFQKNVQ